MPLKTSSLLTAALLFCLSACSTESTIPLPDIPGASPASGKYCGDGICGGPENVLTCPEDCGEDDSPENSSQPPSPAVPLETPISAPVITDVPPLYFFYIIHSHASGDAHPYQDLNMTQLDTQAAENVIAAIDGIDEVLDRYQVKGTYELTYSVAKGLCEYQGDNHIFNQLQAEGDEIAVHAHKTEYIEKTFEHIQDDCGITADTTSGFILDANRAGTAGANDVVSLAIQIGIDQGMTVGTVNLSPGGGKNPFGEVCHNQIGVGNTMYEQSGNLMFPWRPDYINHNICADNPQAGMTFIDHVSIEWTILPGQSAPSDILGDANFAQLQVMFDGALDYLEENRPDKVAVWGFVTHITEYAQGGSAEYPPAPAALDALASFLAYVDSKQAEGRVVFVTANEIAELAFP